MPHAVPVFISISLVVIAIVALAYVIWRWWQACAQTNLFKSVMANISDGVVTLDADRSVRSLNTAATKMFGRFDGAVSGLRLSDLLPDAPEIGHEPQDTEYRTEAIRSNGTFFPVEVKLLARRNQRDSILIIRDLSRVRLDATEEEQRFK